MEKKTACQLHRIRKRPRMKKARVGEGYQKRAILRGGEKNKVSKEKISDPHPRFKRKATSRLKTGDDGNAKPGHNLTERDFYYWRGGEIHRRDYGMW